MRLRPSRRHPRTRPPARLRRRRRDAFPVVVHARAAEAPRLPPARKRAVARDTFTRTPSFAWQPVMGANRYEFQLATSHTFGVGRARLARKTTRDACRRRSRSRFRGSPARRTRSTRASAVSRRTARPRRGATLFGFNMRWTSPADAARAPHRPDPLDAGRRRDRVPGLVPRAGQDLQDADDRRRRARVLHVAPGPVVDGTVHWRIRAVRAAVRRARATALPAVSYGPWSPRLHVDEQRRSRAVRLTDCRDDLRHDLDRGHARCASRHARVRRSAVTPASTACRASSTASTSSTDRDCVNIVFRGAVVGGPAYAPRWNGTLGAADRQRRQLDGSHARSSPPAPRA